MPKRRPLPGLHSNYRRHHAKHQSAQNPIKQRLIAIYGISHSNHCQNCKDEHPLQPIQVKFSRLNTLFFAHLTHFYPFSSNSRFFGRPGGTRTPNSRFWRPVLYQLNYWPFKYVPKNSHAILRTRQIRHMSVFGSQTCPRRLKPTLEPINRDIRSRLISKLFTQQFLQQHQRRLYGHLRELQIASLHP